VSSQTLLKDGNPYPSNLNRIDKSVRSELFTALDIAKPLHIFQQTSVQMKLMVLCPITSTDFKKVTAQQARFLARRDTEVEVVSIEKGPVSIESTYESATAEPYAIEKIREAEMGF